MVNDTISRRAAIEAVEFGITYVQAINIETGEVTDLSATTNFALEKAITRIKNIPSAERRGRWIHKDPSGTSCSKCGSLFPLFMGLYDYCPNCGAQMEATE